MTKRVAIGIYVHSEPERLRGTLESLNVNTQNDHQLFLLPDGADTDTINALEKFSYPQSSTADPRGVSACFNRLAVLSDADVIILLESGCIVGPNWMSYLLQALENDPRNGLAGPSTNLVWNEQCAFPRNYGTLKAVSKTASEAAAKFGNQVRTLEQLYGLADFCYAVKREVIEAVGAADESYGLGPCWEMDYNIRAARSGWRGVWACGAYVYRSPFTSRRAKEEVSRFEINKRLYQDRFCGGRLRGTKADYRTHCRGDECVNFAPADLITIHRVFPKIEEKAIPIVRPIDSKSADSPPVSVCKANDAPLVTCIMPTFNRRQYIPQAIRSFQRQTYDNKELLIVDDGHPSIEPIISADDRVRYLRLDEKVSLGAKRNIACENANGELIVHWDDDDWYANDRIARQIAQMNESGAGTSGTSRVYYHEASTNRSWEYRYGGNRKPWVAGNTLAYRKSVWQKNKFQNIQVGEDVHFVWNEPTEAVIDLGDPTLCVASVHSGNTSAKSTGDSTWHDIDSKIVEDLLGDEINFYRYANEGDLRNIPLVSCIMPTFNRRKFVPQAVAYFCMQDYPNKELIIVDDGDDSVEDLASDYPGVIYIRLESRHSIGAKRNIACRAARGEIIAHWDDDDWYSPDRLRYQAAPIVKGETDITGLENSFVFEIPTKTFWTTKEKLHRRMFVGDIHGGTLVFRKEILNRGLNYPEIDLAEDAWLVHRAVKMGLRLRRLSNPGVFVYVRHSSNAWRECQPGKFLDPNGWQKIVSPKLFPKDFEWQQSTV